MKSITLTILSLLSLLILTHSQTTNNFPVIGIVDLTISSTIASFGILNTDTYLAASYVSQLLGAGARVIRIPWEAANVTSYLNLVNGVFFTGGAMGIKTTSGALTTYAKALQNILNYVKTANDNGEYFPLWGTCQGFEGILAGWANAGSVLTPCTGFCTYVSGNDYWYVNNTESRLFANLPANLVQAVQTENLTLYDHQWQVSDASFHANAALSKDVRPLLYSYDAAAVKFVAAFEAINYPIYGTQFHAEKSTFEWQPQYATMINHGPDAIAFQQYLANFFVSEVRKNQRSFDSTTWASLLSFNWVGTQLPIGAPFSEVYLFGTLKATEISALSDAEFTDFSSD